MSVLAQLRALFSLMVPGCRVRIAGICGFLGAAFSASLVPAAGIVVDHTSVALFEQIPEEYLAKARELRILFMDRSVGVNTHEALDCLTAARYGAAPVNCRRDYRRSVNGWSMKVLREPDNSPDPVSRQIRFMPDARRYDRTNWKFFIFADSWNEMVRDFIQGIRLGGIPVKQYPGNASVSLNPRNFDVISFQFGYLNVADGSNIETFFDQLPGEFDDVYDLEREVENNLAGAHPPTVFAYWTTNLARAIGTRVSTGFNERMRRWCRENGKILFDFADIQAHDGLGRPCVDNRDGVAYRTPSGNKQENHPDDGVELPAICQDYTVETDGGHLSTAQGTISVAKAFWVFAARLAGWNPEGGQ